MASQDVDKLWSSIHWLRILSQQGSFTSTALYLSVSKAAVSQRIAELERVARVPLLQRTTRSVRLTAAGVQLVEETYRSYDDIRRSFEKIQNLSNEPTGKLRITAPVALTRQHLVRHLPKFHALYPNIKIELEMNDTFRSLVGDGFDLAIRHVDKPPDAYVAKKLFSTKVLLVASPKYLAKNGIPAQPMQLVEHTTLLYSNHADKNTWIFTRINDTLGDFVTVPVRGDIVVNNSEALRHLACTDVGVALLPDFSAQSAIQNGELVELMPRWRCVSTFGGAVYLLRPYTSTASSRALTIFINYLVENCSKGYKIQNS